MEKVQVDLISMISDTLVRTGRNDDSIDFHPTPLEPVKMSFVDEMMEEVR